MPEPDPLPFDDSRRLTGPNPYFSGTGAVLETALNVPVPDSALERWHGLVEQALRALGWPVGAIIHRIHASGATLALEAPFDQLYAATEVNEWAWLQTLDEAGMVSVEALDLEPESAVSGDIAQALHSLRCLAQAEAKPELVVLVDAAHLHRLPCLIDDEAVSIGSGEGSHTWAMSKLPIVDAVPWADLHIIPTALVTGTNGKTTTVRLLAAMLRAQHRHTAHSCTDGLYLDGELLESGDYSGPAGARALLRNRSTQAAVLEAARGGLLRRGLALRHADVAIVTNVQPDHLGEYGIHDLDALARVKLTVARAIDADGLLILNADDERLRRLSGEFDCPRAWFSLNNEHPTLQAQRSGGDTTCAPVNDRLCLSIGHRAHDLGAIASMPITLAGSAHYNVANAAAASLAAHALGVPVASIAEVLAHFGNRPEDNPGRLQRWQLAGIEVFIDFAHNPDGLSGLLAIAKRYRHRGRLALTLGQAGDRSDEDLRALADAAATAHPDLVILKELKGYERGRAEGEVAAILDRRLKQCGLPASHLKTELDEVAAVRLALDWARPGDVLVLPTHAGAARAAVNRLLSTLQQTNWFPGQPLPDPGPSDTLQH